MSQLLVTDIECRYDDLVVVKNLSFHVNEGQIVSLLGASGCGKTTVLRAIAGFEPIFQGKIRLAESTVSAPGINLAPEHRQVGMVFQDYSLFPHLNIYANICFGLSRQSRDQQRKHADQLLETVGLSGYGERYPHELSGGQQQRVALARALAPQPKLLLMDEPFSSLDVELRERLSLEVRDILKSLGITGILVTHDQYEAFAMCEQVGVMHEGVIRQWDTPYNLYHEPADRFIADFIGQGVFLRGQVLAPDTLETEIGIIKGNRAYLWETGTPVDVLVRPDDIVPGTTESNLSGVVLQKAFKGPEIMYTLKLANGTQVLSMFPSHRDYEIGSELPIEIESNHLVAFAT